MPHIVRELFPDAGTFTRCHCCQGKLSVQRHANQRTRLFGLCFVCLAEFDRSEAYCVDTFLKGVNRCRQKNKRNRLAENRRRRLAAWRNQEVAEIRQRVNLKKSAPQ